MECLYMGFGGWIFAGLLGPPWSGVMVAFASRGYVRFIIVLTTDERHDKCILQLSTGRQGRKIGIYDDI